MKPFVLQQNDQSMSAMQQLKDNDIEKVGGGFVAANIPKLGTTTVYPGKNQSQQDGTDPG